MVQIRIQTLLVAMSSSMSWMTADCFQQSAQTNIFMASAGSAIGRPSTHQIHSRRPIRRITQTSLYESTVPRQGLQQQQQQPLDRTMPPDWITISLHTITCLLAAVLFCAYEDYDCNNLKPNVSGLRPQAVRGLGQGRLHRLEYAEILVSPSDVSLKQMMSYNEIMQEHRGDRVPQWQQPITEEAFRGGISSIYNAMDATVQLQALAQDYDWMGMRELIREPVLSTDLEEASAILRGATEFLSAEARSEIGFDWGSCAWRHCGAQADAQEALAELNNLSGVLEPFECEFIIDIVNRSLRDMLAVIPPQYLSPERLAEYQPYESKNIMDENNEESSIDQDYLKALDDLRMDLLNENAT